MKDIQMLAAQLQAYESSIFSLPDWVHISWCEHIGLDGDVCRSASPGRLATALGVGVAPADVFDTVAHRVAVLPHPMLCRVLRARGLMRRRLAIRRCVDAALLRRLIAWLYPAVFTAVLQESPDGLHGDLAGLPLASVCWESGSIDALAWEGFCLFEADGVWTNPELRRLVRLRFPMSLTAVAGLEAHPGAPGSSAWVLERVVRFVPEAPWLSG